MSDQHPNGEDIARMLREQGPVQAPPDLADDVMRQVRAETGPEPARRFRLPRLRPVLVPALGLAGAAALLVGITHLGSLSSSESSGAGATSAERAALPNGSAASGGGVAGSSNHTPAGAQSALNGFVISSGAARKLSQFGAIVRAAGDAATPSAIVPKAADSQAVAELPHYELVVRGPRYAAAAARLRALSTAYAQAPSGHSAVLVILKRKP